MKEERPEAVNFEREEAALAKATAASRAAAEALDDGGAVNAVETQEAAVAAVDAASARLKNHQLAAGLGVLTIIIIVVWLKFAPQKLRLMPGPLLAIIVATALAASFALPVFYVNPPDSIVSAISPPSWSALQNAPWLELLPTALLIAAVASAETLLCATAVDQLQQGKQRTNYDRELGSQGVGNMICGFLGGLPMTGVIVRSSTNVNAGAQTRLSAILHGLWLLVFVAALGWILRLIPTASLAAVLVYTGYKLINLKQVRKLYEAGWGEVAIYLVTLTTIVVEDLLTGVLVGIALAAAKLLYTFSHLVVKVERNEAENRYTMRLAGAATFVRLPKLAAALEEIPGDTQLYVELDRLTYIDHACLELFTNWAKQHESSGGRLTMDWDSLHTAFREGPEKSADLGDDTWLEDREPALSR